MHTMKLNTKLSECELKVISSAKTVDHYVNGHGSTINSLERKGYVKYLGFNQNIGSVFGLTEEGIKIYNDIKGVEPKVNCDICDDKGFIVSSSTTSGFKPCECGKREGAR